MDPIHEGSPNASARPERDEEPRPYPASLLRRLGEAAYGYQTGEEVWIVANWTPPHALKVFDSRAGATAFREGREDAAELGVFGPYVTPRDPETDPKLGVREVVSIAITVRLPGGEQESRTFRGDEYDALFWSVSAVDKFMVPYYVGVEGLEVGGKVRRALAEPNTLVLAHLPDTTYAAVEFLEEADRKPSVVQLRFGGEGAGLELQPLL